MPEGEYNNELIKAASLVYGVGGRGETCGTVQGTIMFLGVLYGEDTTTSPLVPTEAKDFIDRVSIITEFANTFEEKWGTTQCDGVHGQIMGKHYDMQKFNRLMKFYSDGADEKCQAVVESAIRLVCDLILDENGDIISRA